MKIDKLLPGSNTKSPNPDADAMQAQMKNRRLGSNRSDSPSNAEVSAPTTNPAGTELFKAACRPAEIENSRSMSGNTADEINHKLSAETCAITRRAIDKSLVFIYAS